jgi:urease beta subunit
MAARTMWTQRACKEAARSNITFAQQVTGSSMHFTANTSVVFEPTMSLAVTLLCVAGFHRKRLYNHNQLQ